MKRKYGSQSIIALFTIFAIYACSLKSNKSSRDTMPEVDVFAHTKGDTHVFLGVNTPSGNIRLGPQTNGTYDGTGYHYNDSIITGFILTHTAGKDAAFHIIPEKTLRFLPTTGNERNAKFSHTYEIVRPGYYSVYMHNIDIAAELIATGNVGFQRYFFPPKDSVQVIVNRELIFTNDSMATAQTADAYYAIQFSRPAKGMEVNTELPETTLYFDAANEEMLYVKVGLSLQSVEDAQHKIRKELPEWNFEQAIAKAGKIWAEFNATR